MQLSGTGGQVAARISFQADGTGENKSHIDFLTHDSSALTQAMRITSGQKVGIGETAPLGKIHAKVSDTSASASAQGNLLVLEDTENGLSILSGTSGAGYINFGDSGDNDIGMIIYDHSANAMRFWTSAAERGRFLSNGHFLVGTTTEYSGTSANLTVPLSIDISADDANLKSLFFSRNVGEGEIGGIAAKVTGFSTMGRINFVAENVSGGSQASSIRFKTTESATEREVARFGTDGKFFVNVTSDVGPG